MCLQCRTAASAAASQRYEASGRRRDRYKEDAEYKGRADAAVRRYRAANRDRLADGHREKHRTSRQIVIDLYGRRCACCGETRWQFLALDHVNGGGNAHRRLLSTTSLYRRLAKAAIVDPAYRLLCHNCNGAIGYYGVCPHDAERQSAVA